VARNQGHWPLLEEKGERNQQVNVDCYTVNGHKIKKFSPKKLADKAHSP